jgi:hypothetical protein
MEAKCTLIKMLISDPDTSQESWSQESWSQESWHFTEEFNQYQPRILWYCQRLENF